MRLFSLFVMVFASLVIPSQVPALEPQEIGILGQNHSLTPRDVFHGRQPSYEGILPKAISDLHLSGKLHNPWERNLDSKIDYGMILDPKSCTGREREMTLIALRGAGDLANIAAKAAISGSDAWFRWCFRTDSPEIRKQVAAHYRSIAANAFEARGYQSKSKRPITYYCSEHEYSKVTQRPSYCQRGYGAYAHGLNIVNCRLYYERVPSSTTCENRWRGSRPGVTHHEMTHVGPIFDSKNHVKAKDHAYAFDTKKWNRMTKAQRLNNASAYEFYAYAVAISCPNMEAWDRGSPKPNPKPNSS